MQKIMDGNIEYRVQDGRWDTADGNPATTKIYQDYADEVAIPAYSPADGDFDCAIAGKTAGTFACEFAVDQSQVEDSPVDAIF